MFLFICSREIWGDHGCNRVAIGRRPFVTPSSQGRASAMRDFESPLLTEDCRLRLLTQSKVFSISDGTDALHCHAFPAHEERTAHYHRLPPGKKSGVAALCSRDKELLRDTIHPMIGVRTSETEAKRWRNSVSNDVPPLLQLAIATPVQ